MEKVKGFLKKKDIVFSVKRYGIDALGAMAQGLFCTLLIGTILNTLGNQFGVGFLKAVVATVNGTDYTVGGLASAMAGPAMAVAIGYALKAPQLVLFSLITVGFAANALGGAGGPLAVYFIAVIATELGKVVSKETKIDILVTPLVTIGSGVAVSALLAPTLGAIAMKVGHHAGYKPSAVLDGYCGISSRRCGTYTSDIIRCDMCGIRTYRSGRRCCCGGMLCADGWICSYVIQRE